MTQVLVKRVAQSRSRPRWLTLAFSLPMQPAYARVKIWRHLQSVGAVPLAKNALYVLPMSAAARAAFDWVLAEARSVGGDAVIFEAKVVAGYTDDEIVTACREREQCG